MYCPPLFREERREVLHAAIRAHPLATIVTHGAAGMIANVLPFTLHAGKDGDVLRAHLSKFNDQIADLAAGAECIVIFQGPQAYISASWYPAKAEHGKVVPTWNYVMVQASGTPRIIRDEAWLRAQIDDLTRLQEEPRAQPWQVADAPDDFIAGQLKGVVGLEIPVTRIEGKWKVSQNQPRVEALGVVAGLNADGCPAMADEVTARMRES